MKNKIIDILKIIFLIIIPFLGITYFYNRIYYRVYDILFVFLIIIFILCYKKIKKEKLNIWLLLLALLYSMLFVFGTNIEVNWNNQFSPVIFSLSNVLFLYSFTILFYMMLVILCSKLGVIIQKKEKTINLNKKNILIIFVIFIIMYLPYYIMLFPGMLTVDSFIQIDQALGVSALTNHHPIVHTMLIKIFLNIGSLIGSKNIGVGLYSLFQIIIMSMIFTYFICFLIKNKCSRKLIYGSILYFTIVPIFGFYSMTMWKDILFSTFCLGLIIQLYILCMYEQIKLLDKILLIVFIVLVSLFRSNGIYITVALSLVTLIFLKGKRKLVILLCLIPSILSFFTVSKVYSYLGISEGNYAETVGIPLRQITSIVAEGLDIDEESYEFINNMMPIEKIKENYIYSSVDPIKFDESFSHMYLGTHKSEFFKTWFKLLKKYPIKFVDVYLKNTYGFWYLDTNGYGVHEYAIENNEYEIRTKFPEGVGLMSKYYEWFITTPVLKYLLVPAFCFVVLMFFMVLAIFEKKYKYLLLSLVPLFSWGTIMIATPVSFQSRYVFSMYTTLPFIIFLIYSLFKDKKVKK